MVLSCFVSVGSITHEQCPAPSTSSIYGGQPVSESSPAFADPRKVRDFISTQKKAEHPDGMGWEGNWSFASTKQEN
jgi:hypothetical protein